MGGVHDPRTVHWARRAGPERPPKLLTVLIRQCHGRDSLQIMSLISDASR